MNTIELSAPRQWSGIRWLVVVALVAMTQAAAFMWLSRWPTLREPKIAQGTSITLEPSLAGAGIASPSGLFWESDPRQFALPDRAGFSGLASRALPPPEYQLAQWAAAPRWLSGTPDPTHLGTIPAPAVIPPAPPSLPMPQPPSGPPTPLVLGNQTKASLSGDLAGREFRALLPPPTAVTGTDVLAPTILDLVVSSGGAVILTRLVSSSGQREADAAAVEWARSLRFIATGFEASPAASDPAKWMTGQLVVHWRVEPGLR